jgi:hypothetical protein
MFKRVDDWVEYHLTTTDNDPFIDHHHRPARHFRVTSSGGTVANDGIGVETITVEVVDGLEIARGIAPDDTTTLNYSGDVTLTIDGVETIKTLTDGSVSFGLTTEKPAGSVIKIAAESLTDHPVESDRVEIEVVQA